jgi:hypothetical protein
MAGEEGAALSQRDGVGKDAVDIRNGGAGDGDEVVADAEKCLPLDADVVMEEEIEVFGDGASEGVLDGDDSGVDRAVGEGGESVSGEGEGHNDRVLDQFDGGCMAK